MATVTLNVTARKRWWFAPWMYGVLAWMFVTGHRPSDAWLTKWTTRAFAFKVKP